MTYTERFAIPEDDGGLLERFLEFVRAIGIIVDDAVFPEETVLPGIDIRNGQIFLDRRRLKFVGDLLHEAGHIAVVPSGERANLHSSTIGSRPDQAAEEMMAIAWSYAAALHIGIDPSVVFHESGYHGGGNYLLENFRAGRTIGVPMLAYTGMCEREPHGGRSQDGSKSGYPRMIRWLRE
jgi:hypothetical protein